MKKRLIRYICFDFFELFFPIFFSLIILAAAFRLTQINDLEATYFSIKSSLLSFLYLVPITVPIILPFSFLFAFTLLCIKWRIEGNFISLFSARITPFRLFTLLVPIVAFLTLLAMLNSLYLKPFATFKLQKLITLETADIIRSLKPGMIKHLEKNSFIFAAAKEENLKDVFYCESNLQKGNITIISAKELFIPPSKETFAPFVFHRGSLVTIKDEESTFSEFMTLSADPFKRRDMPPLSPRSLPTKALFYLMSSDENNPRIVTELCERIFLPASIIIFFGWIFSVTIKCRRGNLIYDIIICLFGGITYFALYFTVYTINKNNNGSAIASFIPLFFSELLIIVIYYKWKFSKIF